MPNTDHFLPSRSKTDSASEEKFSISGRRYLGNKSKLIGFIKNTVSRHCRSVRIIADLFSGTGAVASVFAKGKTIITNDILFSNYICNYAWFSPETFRIGYVKDILDFYGALQTGQDNYMSLNFADTYFSEEDCRKIGTIREDIEKRFRSGDINFREKALLIASLIYAMDRIARTCGHYDAFRKNGTFEGHLRLKFPNVPDMNFPENQCYNEDANRLIENIHADLIYLDPPYNSRQYCDAYHVLENVARWNKPEVGGIARKMDRSGLKSRYCTREAVVAFKDLIAKADARYILLSYNNMGDKGNGRSNARMKDEEILEILRSKGRVQVFETGYRAFSTGKSDIGDNKERLFLCTCR